MVWKEGNPGAGELRDQGLARGLGDQRLRDFWEDSQGDKGLGEGRGPAGHSRPAVTFLLTWGKARKEDADGRGETSSLFAVGGKSCAGLGASNGVVLVKHNSDLEDPGIPPALGLPGPSTCRQRSLGVKDDIHQA